MSTPTNPTPPSVTTTEPRKFPAPCWTHEETLALINSYRDKWYSLRRRNLRSADWDTVAAEVSSRCPDQTPKKTSAQCRHKMEKLRKRYRAEKQKIPNLGTQFSGNSSNNNNRLLFSSSWVYFDLMDAMETGGTVPTVGVGGSGAADLKGGVVVGGKGGGGGGGGGFGGQFGKFEIGFEGGVGGSGTGCSLNEAMDAFVGGTRKGGGGMASMVASMASAAVPVKFKLKSHGGSGAVEYGSHVVGNRDEDDEDEDEDDEDEEEDEEEEEGFGGFGNGGGGGGYGIKGFQGKNVRNSMSNGFERKNGVGAVGFDPRGSNGFWKKSGGGSGSGSGNATGGGGGGASGGGGGRGSGKRGGDALAAEMVASIKMLGEGFIKMEKMKMDMVREIEKMRMEMEMKRSEMILESQQLIVNAFIEGLKNKKPRVKPSDEER